MMCQDHLGKGTPVSHHISRPSSFFFYPSDTKKSWIMSSLALLHRNLSLSFHYYPIEMELSLWQKSACCLHMVFHWLSINTNTVLIYVERMITGKEYL